MNDTGSLKINRTLFNAVLAPLIVAAVLGRAGWGWWLHAGHDEQENYLANLDASWRARLKTGLRMRKWKVETDNAHHDWHGTLTLPLSAFAHTRPKPHATTVSLPTSEGRWS